ncbi:DHHA1 domain-containing protein [Aurantiacibacter zhengii]|nr:DHHA1 domain-containing protein [Aurantiacibacter zhengii]
MSEYAPDIVIYHDKCMDGFTAAWAIWKRWGNAPDYVARNYGMAPDIDADGKHVLIVDFSFPEEQLRALATDGAASIIVLDHHKTAAADLEPFRCFKEKPERFKARVVAAMCADLKKNGYPAILALFDMERSGAGLAWDFAFPYDEKPPLVALVQDRDLWRFALGDGGKFLHLALTSGPAAFDRWDEVDRDIDAFIEIGRAIAAYRDQLVDEICERAVCVVIDGKYGMGVDCPYGLASDVGHRLLSDWPDTEFAAAIVRGEHSVSYSLRSRDDRADVSAIAKKFGGGGHRNAAGFKVPRT